MPVTAVINRKGGSGKSTLATHLAGYCASKGLRVMLGDVDQQQSSLRWLRRRAAQPASAAAPIFGWAVESQSLTRPPAGITHVVLDTPGGLRGFELARVVVSADAILMPVCGSAFDRESAAECFAELMTLPRVASGRCKVAVVGMRLDARTSAGAQLEAWAAQHKIPYVGALRETQGYVRSVEQGLTLFDLPASKAAADLGQWQPILDWVEAAWRAAELTTGAAKKEAVRGAPMVGSAARAASPEAMPSPRREAVDVLDSRILHESADKARRPTIAGRLGRWFFRPG
jgi:chromosome partitioning protein